ncbi:hypothetical protein JYT83_00015 [bacterium AH-315-F18]|nr:hypothetical protein [bacterium AH-315-F18]
MKNHRSRNHAWIVSQRVLCLTGIVLFLFASLVSLGCSATTCKKGDDAYVLAGKRHFEPIVVALAKYNEEKGRYPRYLKELVPKFIAKIPKEPNSLDGKYAQDGKGYIIEFSYYEDAIVTHYFTPGVGWNVHRFK